MKKILLIFFALLPLAVRADVSPELKTVETQAREFLIVTNTAENHSLITINKIGVNTDAKDIAFSFKRFYKFNYYVTCEAVNGRMSYEVGSAAGSDIRITDIQQDTGPCLSNKSLNH